MEQQACHFKVVDGQEAVRNSVDDGLGPSNTPDNGMQWVCAGDPDTSSPMLARVAVAEAGGLAGDELLAVNRVARLHITQDSPIGAEALGEQECG